MANFSVVGSFSVIFVLFASSLVKSAPHIIGGGWNTDIKGIVNSEANRGLLANELPPVKISHHNDHILSNGNDGFSSETTDEGEKRTENNSEQHNRQNVDQISRIRVPPPAMSSMEQINPFLRQKRQACPLPADLNVNQLQTRLSQIQYVGRSVSESTHPVIPANQPNSCPNNSSQWWPQAKDNLRSDCPWKFVEKDLGVNAYPRYIREAQCLCQRCINSAINECQTLRQDVTYFEYAGCENGMALLTKKVTTIAIGCFCAHPPPLQGGPQVEEVDIVETYEK